MGRRAKEKNFSGPEFASRNRPVTRYTEIPPYPSYFDKLDQKEEAIKLWNETCTAMIELGGLIIQVMCLVEVHVCTWLVMRASMKDKTVKESTRTSALDVLRRSAADLSLTMATYTRVHVPKPKEDNKDKNPADDVLGRVAA